MDGRSLKVGVFEYDYEAIGCFRDLPNGNCSKPGIDLEAFNMIMTIAQLDYELIDIGINSHEPLLDLVANGMSCSTTLTQIMRCHFTDIILCVHVCVMCASYESN